MVVPGIRTGRVPAILFAAWGAAASAASPDVNVVVKNSAANPVPVSGQVSIAGAPSVTVSNPVTVANGSGNPVPVAVVSNALRIPYRKMVSVSAGTGLCQTPDICLAHFGEPVPAGMRLVVTNVHIRLPFASSSDSVYLTGLNLWNTWRAYIPKTYPTARDLAAPVTAYFNPGDIPYVWASSDAESFAGASQSLIVTLFGYMEPL